MKLTNPRSGRRRPKTDPVRCVALHPDGGRVFIGGSGANITIWDIDAQRSVGTIEHDLEGELKQIAMSPTGRALVAILSTGIAAWDLEDGGSVFAPHPAPIKEASIRFLPDGSGRVLTTSGGSGPTNICMIWDVATGALLHSLSGDGADIERATLSAAGDRAIAIDTGYTLQAWDLSSGQCIAAIRRAGHSDPSARVLGVAFHPDGRRVLSATLVDTVLFDLDAGEPIWTIVGPSADVGTSVFDESGELALMVGHSGLLELMDLASGQTIRNFRETRGAGEPFALCPDGKRMVCRTADGRSWTVVDLESGAALSAMRAHASSIKWILPHPDRVRVITAGEDEPVMVCSLDTGAPLSMLGRSRDSGTIGGGPVAVSKTGAQALSAHEDGAVNLWNTRQGTCVRVPIAGGPVHCMIFHQDERHALFAIDTRVEIWDLLLMFKVDAIELRSRVSALACFGHRIYAASRDFKLRVWDISSGRCMLASPAESPGDKPALNAWLQWVAFTELKGEIDLVPSLKVMHIDSGEVLGELSWEKFTEIYLVALHEEGELAIVAGADTAHVWDIRHRAWRHSIQLPDCYFIQVAIEIHGGWALLVHRRGVAIWDLTSGELTEEWSADAEVTDAAIGSDGTIAVACSDGGVFLLRTGEIEVPLIEERIESLRTTLAGMADRYRSPVSGRSSSGSAAAPLAEPAETQGNLSWLEAYQAQVDEFEPAADQSLSSALTRLERMVDEVPADPVYPAPNEARRRVRKVIEKYRMG